MEGERYLDGTAGTGVKGGSVVQAPSGRQYVVTRGEQRAVIVEVGGGVREYAVGDRPVLQPYAEDAICDGAHGTPLVPWPNRLGGGRYRFDGTEYQVPLTEPEKNNAIHGFLRWRPWQADDHRDDRVTMRARVHPRPGYPFDLDVSLRYELTAGGLTVTMTAENLGQTAAPYGYGQHPYLSPGSGRIDDAVLQFSAATRIVTDPQRQLPTGTDAVPGGPFDFRDPHPIGPLEIDYAFTDLGRDDDGCGWVQLRGPDDATSRLWVDDSFPYLELFTGDTLASGRRRTGLGVEPMTCPPNALQTHRDVIRLEPGHTVTARWGVQLQH